MEPRALWFEVSAPEWTAYGGFFSPRIHAETYRRQRGTSSFGRNTVIGCYWAELLAWRSLGSSYATGGRGIPHSGWEYQHSTHDIHTYGCALSVYSTPPLTPVWGFIQLPLPFCTLSGILWTFNPSCLLHLLQYLIVNYWGSLFLHQIDPTELLFLSTLISTLKSFTHPPVIPLSMADVLLPLGVLIIETKCSDQEFLNILFIFY